MGFYKFVLMILEFERNQDGDLGIDYGRLWTFFLFCNVYLESVIYIFLGGGGDGDDLLIVLQEKGVWFLCSFGFVHKLLFNPLFCGWK